MTLLVIETIDGITTISPQGRSGDVWAFDGAGEANIFISAWFADDICPLITYDDDEGGFVISELPSGRRFYDYSGE